jgi:twitching motility protein PilU
LDIHELLRAMVENDASDLYLMVNSPPLLRVQGTNQPFGDTMLDADDTAGLANSLMSEEEQAVFRDAKEMNLGVSVEGLGRFRVNVLRQRGTVGMVIRQIKTTIPTLAQLALPAILGDIIMAKRGLILVTGATGSGKSTSLAAMIDHRNQHSRGHIITIEDPVEFVHPNKGCVVTQREVGADTNTFSAALKNTLRQAPDVILIGEIRDAETMEAAITFADTGHLCLGTLHSSNANQTLQRLMNFFTVERHAEIYLQLSMNLRAIISQRLVPGVDGRRVVALEILVATPWVQDLIKKGEVDRIKEAMERDVNEGCQTFDLALLNLYAAGRISAQEALANADSANNLRIRMTQVDISSGASADEAGSTLFCLAADGEEPKGVARAGQASPSAPTVRSSEPPPPTSPATMEALVRGYVATKCRRDIDATLASCSDDFRIETVPLSRHAVGLRGARLHLEGFLRVFPDFEVELDGITFGEEIAAAWGRAHLKPQRHRPEAAAQRLMTLEVFFTFTFAADKITGVRFFFDLASFCGQTGISLKAAREAAASLSAAA